MDTEGVYKPDALKLPSVRSGNWQIENNYITGDNVIYDLSTNTSGEFKKGYPDAIVFGYTSVNSLE